jgi:hypothetical protein
LQFNIIEQIVYKNAARIFHCLKANLNENPILKSLKQQKLKEMGKDENENHVTEVPKINYENSQEKRNTLQLAFSTLKCNIFFNKYCIFWTKIKKIYAFLIK